MVLFGGGRSPQAYGSTATQYVGGKFQIGNSLSNNGGGKWVELTVHADPLYQHLLLTAEKKFWRCVLDGDPPHPFGVEPPKPRLEAIKIVDMTTSNSWAEFAATYRE